MNQIIKFITDEFVHGAHIVSIVAVGIMFSTILILGLPFSWQLLLITYLLYQVIYKYNYYKELHSDLDSNPERANFILRQRKWILLSLVMSVVLVSITLTFQGVKVAALGFFIMIGGILYTTYFKKIRIIGFKNYYIAFFWSLLTYLVSIFYEINLQGTHYLGVFVFFRVLTNTIFFDIKDIDSDRARNIMTIPAYLGKNITIILLCIINTLSFIPLVLGVYFSYLPVFTLSLMIAILNGYFFILKGVNITGRNLRYYSYIFVDGEFIFWPLILVLAHYILN